MISVNKNTISIESHRITSTDRQNKQYEYHITTEQYNNARTMNSYFVLT